MDKTISQNRPIDLLDLPGLPGRQATSVSQVTKDLLLENFPFQPRGNQDWVLEQLAPLLSDDRIKHIVLEAPTGSGKSAIAMAIAQSYPGAYILTANKFLQSQYEGDYAQVLESMKGRSNYSCHVTKGKDCANAPCRLTKRGRDQCSKDAKCGYHLQLELAKHSKISLFNFSAGLAFLNYTGQFLDRPVMIIDEAHLMESQLTSFIELAVTQKDIADFGLARGKLPNFDTLEAYIPFISLIRGQLDETQRLNGFPGDPDRLQQFVWKARKLEQELTDNPGNFVLDTGYDKQGELLKIAFKPLDVAPYARMMLHERSKKLVYMSATILNEKCFARSLGIKPDEMAYLKVPSTFPKENRPIWDISVGRITRGSTDFLLPQIKEQIEQILDLRHKNDKGIILTPSYELALKVYNALPTRLQARILFPRKASEIEPMLHQHEAYPERPSVLLSPAMAEGVDLADYRSRFQIIVKVPFASLNDQVVRARMKKDPDWYATQALCKLVQSYGRSVRSETDFAQTYVLDACFRELVDRNRGILPAWFLEVV